MNRDGMDGMADYIRTPSRMFPDVSDFEAATGFLNSEKVRSLPGLHHPHPFGGSIHAPHPHSPRLPPMPLATIQQHLFAIQQRNNAYSVMPSPSSSSGGSSGGGGNNQILPIPFPHHLLSQWTLAAAAGFGLNQLGLFGLGGLPGSSAGLAGSLQPSGNNPSISPPQSNRQPSPPSPLATPPATSATTTGSVSQLTGLTGDREAAANVLKVHSPPHRQHRFSPYPAINLAGKMVTSCHPEEPSERSLATASAGSKLTFDK